MRYYGYSSPYNHYYGFLLTSLIAILIGIWFSEHQLTAITVDAAASYPIAYRVLAVFKCYCVVIAFFSFSHLMLSVFSRAKVSLLSTACTYIPLLLIYASYPWLWVLTITLISQLALLIATWNHNDYVWLKKTFLNDVIAICLFVLVHILFTTRFFPLNWNSPLLVNSGMFSEEIPVLAPLFRGYLLAKQFSFS